ncbi:MAG TPA: DUF1801 domain-containing protein [Candidatus Saccharibacteria bacterium]|nr:DUF1801 domain-containing protein [Candidatus Saccharibacteria bacterium]HRK94548.1 DUF1801 domain-containing protein [Candidatus Saccharibacteria bacterium]
MNTPTSIDECIATYDEPIQDLLKQMRTAIHEAVPEATEAISYGLPTFRINGKNMVHFGAGKHHIGFYATPDGHAEFEPELSKYKRGKGSVQFPLDQPLPLDLVKRIAQYRAEQLRK